MGQDGAPTEMRFVDERQLIGIKIWTLEGSLAERAKILPRKSQQIALIQFPSDS